MSDGSATKGLRERLASGTEDRLGRALTDLFDNPLVGGAIGRASDAREKAAQAQELAMGALNLPSAADVERLTRRLRSISQRLEGIEDGVHRIGRSLGSQSLDVRLCTIEEQLKGLSRALGQLHGGGSGGGSPVGSASAEKSASGPAASKPAVSKPAASKPAASKSAPSAKSAASKPKPAARRKAAAKGSRSDAKAGPTRRRPASK
jgi:hypothetical protein